VRGCRVDDAASSACVRACVRVVVVCVCVRGVEWGKICGEGLVEKLWEVCTSKRLRLR
jgi:hypothetical protein